jgi:peptide/nickel transport system ATP-binding protein
MSALLQFEAVSKRFSKRLDFIERFARRLGADVSEHTVHAVDRVSFDVGEREVVGLVGESGCGKSTLGRIACGLYEPSEGTVSYRGRPVGHAAGAQRPIQMIFQDPFASLNPRMRVADIVGEAPRVHGLVDAGQVED